MLNVTIGALNTAVLIGSSLTMAMAVCAPRRLGKRSALVTFLVMTIILGLAFVLIKPELLSGGMIYVEGLCARPEFQPFPERHAKSVGTVFSFSISS